ncbi:Holliday junction resolvase RuvX [Spiroplasma endosymbiont of Asaphidion curtum]|uniref:Holliday junction resolvase RuvX n=1 Tax=Spiroplasma endosymbiont of Asaphidion curtum TaxID=3066281 RepID=UPI00313CA273
MKYLGLDVGSKTIGLAIGQGIISLSKTTINFSEYNFSKAINLILQFVKQENIDIIIVGHPLNMNGSKSRTTIMVEDFVLQLKTKTNLEIILWDERLTSRSANQIMLTANVSRKKRKMNKDKLAAQLILQNYFDYLQQLAKAKKE